MRYTQKQVLESIKDTGGIISTIANRMGCAWSTAQIYINRWESTRTALKDESNKIADFAEGKVIEAIKSGDVNTAKWYLTKKAKDRGYGDIDTAPPQNTENEDNELRIILSDDNTK